MTSSAGNPSLYTIPAGMPFLDALAAGLSAQAGDDPAALSKMTVLLPTRRACRSLAEAFLRQGGGRPVLLPNLTPLGDLDEDELAMMGTEPPLNAADGFNIPPAVSGLHRQMMLSRMILALDKTGTTPDQAARLALELARLLDQVHTERLSLEKLKTLVPDVFAAHWQKTLAFLKILTDHWPGVLAAEGCLDPAARRNLLIEAQAEAWRASPPADPIIAAGSTGSIPATADLLGVIARLPKGAVVLPGLERHQDEETWAALGPSHPQFGMKRLLDHLGLAPRNVADWPAPGIEETPPSRAALINGALRPASTPVPPEDAGAVGEALDGITRIDCPSPREEAGVIALIMRETLETEAKTCALVTPDRGLARRVATELERWGVDIDDSAGRPLAQTPPGGFFRLCLRMAADGFAPVSLLALCKHPLAGGGMEPVRFRSLIRKLEISALRGPRPGDGIAGLRAALTHKNREPLAACLDILENASAALTGLLGKDAVSLSSLITAHTAMAEALAATADRTGMDSLWAKDAGRALAAFVSELNEASGLLGDIKGRSYPALFDTLMAGRVVRPGHGRHPRLQILGLMEARLLHADVMILGGLNENTWPPEAKANPWMSRPMMNAFGLPTPERRIGLAAHDFTQAFSAPRVFLTRAARVEGTPNVPSRWLLKLENRLLGMDVVMETNTRWLGLYGLLDRAPGPPSPIAPPEPRPPLSARPRQLSVTQVETWIRDPYAIYARKVLGLNPLDPIDADPGAAERGTFIHDALEKFVREFPEDLPEKALDRLIEIGEGVFQEHLARPGVRAFWWPRFLRIAHWFIGWERQRRGQGQKNLAVEVKGRLVIAAPTGDFILTARADRIDARTDGGLVLIDYKTGAPPSAKQVESGLTPQLSLEAAMGSKGCFEGIDAADVAQLIYVKLSGARTPGEEKVLKLDVPEVAENALTGLTEYIATFDFPKTPYRSRPRPMFESRYGDYSHLARIKEWSSGGGGE